MARIISAQEQGMATSLLSNSLSILLRLFFFILFLLLCCFLVACISNLLSCCVVAVPCQFCVLHMLSIFYFGLGILLDVYYSPKRCASRDT
ncbi:hypothetical protein EI94DRAFT_1733877 [Lactarius quietus]|nr:hypothetical protein EI94DRAFT_1733877 [Lactarius quietus]